MVIKPRGLSLVFVFVWALGADPYRAPAASAAGAAPSPANERTFTFRLTGEPETLDWNRAHTPIETHLLMNLMEGLVAFDQKLKVVPALAQSWSQSDGGKVYTFKLRKDVKWSDGVPLKAADFVFSWQRLLSPLTAASYAYFLFDIEGAEDFNKGKHADFNKVGVKALDDHTLQVRLICPVAHWVQIPTFWVTFPLRKDIVAQHGQSWEKPGRMVTLGPFVLASYEMDSKVTLKANQSYYGRRGNVDQAVGLIVKDDVTAMNLYETGRLDFLTDLGTLDAKRLAGHPDLKTFPYLKINYLGFNTQKFPLNSARVRRAIAMGIDKSKIPGVLNGGQTPATSFIPPGVDGHDTRSGLKFDPIVARSELKLSGIDTSVPVKLDLVLPNWDKAMTLAQFIQAELKRNLSLNVVLQPFDHKTYRSHIEMATYPLFTGTWAADYPDPDNFFSIFLSQSGNNRTQWKGPASKQFDDWVLKARATATGAARSRLYKDAQKMLVQDEAIVVPLFYEPIMGLVRPRVKGLELNPLNYLYLRQVNLSGL